MLKACSKCGRLHDYNYKCNVGKMYGGGDERKLRNTFAWAQKSRQVRDDANWLCEACRDKGKYVYDNLEVHHIVKIADDKSLLLEDSNLVCLCVECHKLADAGRIDPDYLRELAARRGARVTPWGSGD